MQPKIARSLTALAIPALFLTTVPAGAVPTARTAAPAPIAVDADRTAEWNHGRGRHGHRGWDDRGYRRSAYNDGYYGGRRQAYYGEPVYANTRIWRGNDGRYYCRRENGTTGLLIGAAVGGLAGHEIAGRGDRTLGAILGAAGGALLGRAIDRSNARCR